MGGSFGALASPGRPSHIRKFFLGRKTKFITVAGNLRPILVLLFGIHWDSLTGKKYWDAKDAEKNRVGMLGSTS